MLRKIFATGILLSTNYFTWAQEPSVNLNILSPENSASSTETETKKDSPPFLTINGSVDAYYRYDISKQKGNNRTSFTNTQNDFALGMASVKFSHTGSKVSAVADLGFGTRATEFAYNDAGSLAAIKQLYISYTPLKDFKITAGTWATHVGYELVDPQLNRNYSMSYMFTNGPFTHTGVKAEYAKGKSGFMFGVSNATDYRILPDGQIDKKFLIAQYTYTPTDKIKIYANYVGGKSPDTTNVNQFDITATASISKKCSIGLNSTLNQTHLWKGFKYDGYGTWWGTAAYINYDAKEWMGFSLRSEYFNDADGIKGIGSKLFANTLSANFKTEGFIIIPEIRYEMSPDEIYLGSNNGPKKSTTSFLIAAVYQF